MAPAKQKSFQAAADKAIAWSAAEHLKREAELADGFRKQGLEVYAPDVNAFREHAQKVYLGLRRGEGLAEGHAREDQRAEVDARVNLAGCEPGCAAARRTSPRRCSRVMFVAFIVQIVFRYLFNFPVGWTSELTRHRLALAGAAGARPSSSRRARRSASTSSTGRSARARGASMGIVIGVAILVAVRACRCRPSLDYVTFMKVEKTLLPQDPLRLAVLDLHPLRSRRSSSATLWILSQLLRGKDPEAAPTRPR